MNREDEAFVFVVILNWNGWRDTITCLESVFQLDQQHFVVVVCDNHSSDSSLENIVAWANGELAASATLTDPGKSVRVVQKPIAFARYSRRDAERTQSGNVPLVLIDNGANLGFAGGNNVGIRHALAHPTCSYVWVLNNDTVVEPTALTEMLALSRADPRVGICGSQIRYFGSRQKIQSFGGRLNSWFCTTHHLYCGAEAAEVREAPRNIDYVPGVSMLVSRTFLEDVGLMAEDYFLYFEEIDWAERGKPNHRLAVCSTSIVYHVGGASIGSPSDEGERGLRSEYFLLRGRLLFARKFYRSKLSVVYLGLFASLLKRLLRRKWLRAHVALCAILGIRPSVLGARAESQAGTA